MSFKKSLAALAVLSTAAGFAAAANVSVYGYVDEALLYTYEKTTGDASENNFGLESGINYPSRFGLKGSEELGNGLTVSFKLENGFSADDGTLSQNGRLFGREASLTVSGDFGAVSFGRMGGVGSSCGTYDLVYGFADAFDGFDFEIGGLAISDRYDNMVTYQTPKFAGVQGTFQYSFNQDTKAYYGGNREGSGAVDRYASAAVTGEFGNLNLIAAYEFQNYSTTANTFSEGADDGHTVYIGGNYNCGFATTYVMAQYFKGLQDLPTTSVRDTVDTIEDVTNGKESIKGWGLHLGTNFDALAGNWTVGLYYVDAEEETAVKNYDIEYIGAGVRYSYALSKRTSIYAGAGASQLKYYNSNAENVKDKYGQAYLGLTHAF